ncbi:hypothetical protein LCGC14_1200100 [marine sediment metagenome]|uniref:Uncharacterized protein n=1 Tax=marine sediment metagenome TaxID=412755 RepID=A0A0F9LH96_9ZZZZ
MTDNARLGAAIEQHVSKLKAENARLGAAIEQHVSKLKAENAKLQEALERIKTWSEAYPLKAFPKPDLKKAREVLEAADMTLDAISADAMRHVINGVKNIISEALKEK